MLWLALHLPALPLQALANGADYEQANQTQEAGHHKAHQCTTITPELTGRANDGLARSSPPPAGPPIAIFAPTPKRPLIAINAAAAHAGVRVGMPLATALVIFPQLKVTARTPSAEQALLENLAHWATQFTPQVCIDAPSGLVLEIEASLKLFGGIAALQQHILEGCRHQGLSVHTAVAPTPLAARWLALTTQQQAAIKVATLPSALAGLPIEVLDANTELIKLLHSVGVSKLGQCLRLPRAGLAQRGGRKIQQQLDQALGLAPDPRQAFQPPPRFYARQELMFPAEDTAPLLFAVKRQVSGLAGSLAPRQAGIESLTLTLEQENGHQQVLHIRLGSLSRDEQRFFLLVKEHLSRIPLTAPVLALSLAAPEILPLAGHNRALFGDPATTAEDGSLLVERLQARLGENAVCSMALCADHRPEMAWCKTPPGQTGRAPPPPAPRPLWLLPEAAPLPCSDGHPLWEIPLNLLAGPERIASGWWDDPAPGNPGGVKRDYYIAQGASHSLLWIYRDLQPPGQWYLQGIFA